MKLTHMESAKREDGTTELRIELNGAHWEMERFPRGTDAIDLANRLRRLAARIEARTRMNPAPERTDG